MDWNAFAADYAQFPLPETEEWEKAEGRRIPSRPVETEEFIRLEYLYKFLAELLLSEQYGLSQLDRRLTEEGYLPVPEEKQDYFQKYDRSGLQFFCLRCPVHIERLTKEELRVLTADGSGERGRSSAPRRPHGRLRRGAGEQHSLRDHLLAGSDGRGHDPGPEGGRRPHTALPFCRGTARRDPLPGPCSRCPRYSRPLNPVLPIPDQPDVSPADRAYSPCARPVYFFMFKSK